MMDIDKIVAEAESEGPFYTHKTVRSLIDAVRELQVKFPCGHRKVDADNSYGDCVFCIYKKAYWDDEQEHDEILAQLVAKDKEIGKLKEEIARLRTYAASQVTGR